MKKWTKVATLITTLSLSLVLGISIFNTTAKADTFVSPTSGIHYQQPSSTIYIQKRTPKRYRKMIKKAVHNWNSTNAFHWQLSNSNKATTITITNSHKGFWGSNHYAGVTFNQVPNYPSNSVQSGAKININSRVMNKFHYTYKQRLLTIEHEMGHAIGLKHNKYPLSIMYPNDTFYNQLSSKRIPSSDILGVKAIYGEQ